MQMTGSTIFIPSKTILSSLLENPASLAPLQAILYSSFRSLSGSGNLLALCISSVCLLQRSVKRSPRPRKHTHRKSIAIYLSNISEYSSSRSTVGNTRHRQWNDSYSFFVRNVKTPIKGYGCSRGHLASNCRRMSRTFFAVGDPWKKIPKRDLSQSHIILNAWP